MILSLIFNEAVWDQLSFKDMIFDDDKNDAIVTKVADKFYKELRELIVSHLGLCFRID